ncbi:MAG: hydrogenase maturation peptidase HycI [Candidatus Thermoplasmatota archaeon]|nr:hydrogenase maturation peptidase HycI [Candidatus Thermoplasmatota archaeon]
MVNILMGIGNALGGDDAIGPWIAKNFKHRGWLSIDCGTVPENFTSLVKEHRSKYLVIVDAAQLNLAPGEFRVVPKDKIDTFALTTHSLPLSFLISYLEEYAENIICIGVQPKSVRPFSTLSKEVRAGALKIIKILKQKKFDSLIAV